MYKLSFLFISLACFVNKGKSENRVEDTKVSHGMVS